MLDCYGNICPKCVEDYAKKLETPEKLIHKLNHPLGFIEDDFLYKLWKREGFYGDFSGSDGFAYARNSECNNSIIYSPITQRKFSLLMKIIENKASETEILEFADITPIITSIPSSIFLETRLN